MMRECKSPEAFVFGLPGKPSLMECLKAAVQYHNNAGRVDPNAATRSSLIKLAHSAITLHAKALAKGVLPRTADERSKPLMVALTALQTIAKNEGV